MPLSYQAELERAQAGLERARQAVMAEISSYPTPISGCDAQFNHLLSERSRIGEALAALGSAPFVPTPRIPVQGARVESR